MALSINKLASVCKMFSAMAACVLFYIVVKADIHTVDCATCLNVTLYTTTHIHTFQLNIRNPSSSSLNGMRTVFIVMVQFSSRCLRLNSRDHF